MEVITEERETCTLVRVVATRLDVAVAQPFKAKLEAIPVDKRNIVLDLSEVPFVDSTGLGALLSFLRKIAQANGRLRLSGLCEQVSAMFMLVRMNKVFDLYDTADQACGNW